MIEKIGIIVPEDKVDQLTDALTKAGYDDLQVKYYPDNVCSVCIITTTEKVPGIELIIKPMLSEKDRPMGQIKNPRLN